MKKVMRHIEMFLYFLYNVYMNFKNAVTSQSTKGGGKIRKASLILLFLIIYFCLYAQNENIGFKHIKGDYQSTAHCILQDKRGFMWFGTRDGLARYDGYDFKIYKPDRRDPGNSISDSWILSIIEASDGMLWVGTKNGGLNKFDPESERFTHYKPEGIDPGHLWHDEVGFIFEDSKGVLWIGTKGGGLNIFDRKDKKFIKCYQYDKNNKESLGHNNVTCICEMRSGEIWIGTEGGLNKLLDREKGTFKRFTKSLSDNKIKCIYEDRSGVLWIGTKGGGLIKLIDPKKEIFTSYKCPTNDSNKQRHSVVNSIYEDRSGVLWIGTADGLNALDRSSGQFTSYMPNNVFSIYEDRTGILWIGTHGGGIFMSSLFASHQINITGQSSNFKINNDITCFCEHRAGSLLVGTNGGGLYEFDRKKGIFKPYKPDGLPDKSKPDNLERIKSIFKDRSGALWIGTLDKGLNRLSPDRKSFKNYKHNPNDPGSLSNNEVRSIYQDKEGILWVGTRNGLNVLKEGEFYTYTHNHNDPESLSDNSVYIIYEDRSGVLWIGTDSGGLNRFNRKTKKFTSFINKKDDKRSLSHNFVLCIFEDSAGTLWIGTYGGGLNKLDRKKGIFESYQEKEGLPDNKIYGILEDNNNGNLWLSTNNGLSRFNPETKEFKNYDVEDGLQHNEFNGGAYHICKDGEMFFGGINGFNAFFPENIKYLESDSFVPPVVITDFFMDNESVPLQWKKEQSLLKNPIYATKALTLSHSQDAFAFEFAALHFANPQKNMYKYKLEGYDKGWVTTGLENRRATYTNLPAGDYVFKVQGSNKDGIWNKEGTAIKLKILPPPWKTWWAYTLYILFCASVLYSFWSFWYQRKRIAYERKVAQQLRNYQEQLIQAEKMASLGVLVAGVAHELNNPAATTLASAEYFSRVSRDIIEVLERYCKSNKDIKIAGLPYEEAKEEIAKLSKGMLNSSTRINDIIRDLKEYSRKEDSEDKQFVDINKIIKASKNLTNNMIKKATHHFSCELADSLPMLYGSFRKLEQVFINLIQNACQALTNDNQGIYISSDYKQERDEIIVKVRDEGKGIKKNDFKYIIDPFFTTRRSEGGTGLGLYISRQIIEMHGGTINFKSEIGKGTTVSVCLPVTHTEGVNKRSIFI